MFSRAVEIGRDARVLLYARRMLLQWQTGRGAEPLQALVDYRRPHTAPMNAGREEEWHCDRAGQRRHGIRPCQACKLASKAGSIAGVVRHKGPKDVMIAGL